MPRSLFSILTCVAVAASLAACADGSMATAPGDNVTVPVQLTSSASVVNPTFTAVNVLTRTSSIEQTTVTKVIGKAGGTITVPSAGFTLTVPARAVRVNTTFQVTALGGNDVAYEFEPHGATFVVPLVFSQSLANVNVSGNAATLLQGAYFADKAQVNMAANNAEVNEMFPVVVGANGTVTFRVFHFSGYLVSSGRR